MKTRLRAFAVLGALLAVAGLVVVLALTVVQADDGMTGVGSPTACKSANVTGTVDSGDVGQSMDLVTVQAGAGNVVSMVCIKTGADIFPLLGTGDCANVATNGTKSSHSHCITADGQYANGPCYAVSGIGTAKVTVTRKLATCPLGSGISHVDFLAKGDPGTSTPTDTPVPPTDTPTNTPTDTPTNTPTDTPVPATETPTDTPVPATETPTDTPETPTVTNTPVTPTSTPTNTPITPVSSPATATPVTPVIVGGISFEPPAGESSGGAGSYAALAALAAGGLALAGAGWYARRRLLR